MKENVKKIAKSRQKTVTGKMYIEKIIVTIKLTMSTILAILMTKSQL